MNCQAIINDYENGTRYAPQRVTVPKQRPCTRAAVVRFGKLYLCTQHHGLARAGLIAEGGAVESRPVIADVRRYPKKFPHGVHAWQKDVETMPLVHFDFVVAADEGELIFHAMQTAKLEALGWADDPAAAAAHRAWCVAHAAFLDEIVARMKNTKVG